MINAVLKVCLWLVLLGNKPKGRNKQRNFTKLIKQQCKNSSNKACLNVLRVVDARWGGAESSTERSNKTIRDPGTKAGIKRDNKAIRVWKQIKRGDK